MTAAQNRARRTDRPSLMTHDDALLSEQRAYYRAAAAQYDRPYEERDELRQLGR